MGANAQLSWGQVTNKPTIPTLPNYITSTKITSTNIESPTITGGVITGGILQTATTGRRLVVGSSDYSNYIDFVDGTTDVGFLGWDTGGVLSLSTQNNMNLFAREGNINIQTLHKADGSGGGNIYIEATAIGKKTYFSGDVDFSDANVQGVYAKFA